MYCKQLCLVGNAVEGLLSTIERGLFLKVNRKMFELNLKGKIKEIGSLCYDP